LYYLRTVVLGCQPAHVLIVYDGIKGHMFTI